MPPGGPHPCPALNPSSLSVVPFPYLTEFFGWHFPEYKILENMRLCGQILLKKYYLTDPFFLFMY